MKDAVDESFVPRQQAIQQNLYDEFNDYAKLLANTQCVISNFITYLSKVCRYKPQYLMECCNKSDEFVNDCKTLSDISYKLINEKDANLFVEAREFEHKVRWQSTYMLGILNRYIDDITFRLYNIKYNKKIKTDNGTDCENIIQGK